LVDRHQTAAAADPSARGVPLAEENARLVRHTVETGRVRVRLRTEVEEVPVQAELRTETVDVERVAVGRELAPGEAVPAPREEEGGAVLVVPVLEEVLVVEKRLVLTEELRIRRRVDAEPAAGTVTLRRQRAEVERLPPEAAAAPNRVGDAAAVALPPDSNKEAE
jgi:stress response protein YsnF